MVLTFIKSKKFISKQTGNQITRKLIACGPHTVAHAHTHKIQPTNLSGELKTASKKPGNLERVTLVTQWLIGYSGLFYYIKYSCIV